MDAKVTLSFDKNVISKAKKFAERNNISLSRLTEFLYSKITNGSYENLEELPIADGVNMVAEGDIEYKTRSRSRRQLKKNFYDSHK